MSRLTSLVLVVLVGTAQAGPRVEPPAKPAQQTAGPPGEASRATEPVQLMVISLEHADAGQTATMFSGGSRMIPGLRRVVHGPANTLLLVGTPEAIAQTAEAVRQLDAIASKRPAADAAGRPQRVVRSVRLSSAPAHEVAGVLRELLPALASGLTHGASVRIAARSATNELWVYGQPAMVEQVLDLAGELDRSYAEVMRERQRSEVPIQAYTLRYASVKEAGRLVGQILGKVGSTARILPDERTGRLLIAGPPRDQHIVQTALKLIDVPAAPATGAPLGGSP